MLRQQKRKEKHCGIHFRWKHNTVIFWQGFWVNNEHKQIVASMRPYKSSRGIWMQSAASCSCGLLQLYLWRVDVCLLEVYLPKHTATVSLYTLDALREGWSKYRLPFKANKCWWYINVSRARMIASIKVSHCHCCVINELGILTVRLCRLMNSFKLGRQWSGEGGNICKPSSSSSNKWSKMEGFSVVIISSSYPKPELHTAALFRRL